MLFSIERGSIQNGITAYNVGLTLLCKLIDVFAASLVRPWVQGSITLRQQLLRRSQEKLWQAQDHDQVQGMSIDLGSAFVYMVVRLPNC
jgi:hypothetical protein